MEVHFHLFLTSAIGGHGQPPAALSPWKGTLSPFELEAQNVSEANEEEETRTALFWVVTQLAAVISYRSSGIKNPK